MIASVKPVDAGTRGRPSPTRPQIRELGKPKKTWSVVNVSFADARLSGIFRGTRGRPSPSPPLTPLPRRLSYKYAATTTAKVQ